MINGVIYKLFCKNTDIKECYIGSSKDIENRMKLHKQDCNNENSNKYNYKLYEFIRANGNWGNFKYLILEQKEYENEEQLHMREQTFITLFRERNEKLLNERNAYRSEEYFKEYYKDYSKNYYENNKEKKKEYQNEYYEINKDKKREYKEKNKEKLKQYQKEYSEKNREQIKEYREKNKEHIRQQKQEYYKQQKQKKQQQQQQQQ
jgi:hypothetical protein